ncbi:MAG TPA: IS21 family transposase [Rhodanobacteraceae bacterium]|nr:IS21 family transposase [Rhodanobacteraceae bacterium]
MKNLKELLRLLLTTDLTNRQIAALRGVSHNTVERYRRRLEETHIDWEFVSKSDELALDFMLNDGREKLKRKFVEPDWSEIHEALKRKGETLGRLWENYRPGLGDSGLSFTEFCRRYRRYCRALGLVMRQIHRAGEKMFVDYSGQLAWLTDPQTGARTAVQIFVAVLGASSYVYAEATMTQSLLDWIGSHVRAFEYFGGVTKLTVPDNLKSAVVCIRPGEGALLNPSYAEFAAHYGTVIVPARKVRPKDKGKVEAGVRLIQIAVLAHLRNRTFFSLEEMNQAIRVYVDAVNNKPFKKMPNSTRRSLFESLDRPALRPLPAQRYEFAEWRIGVRVGPDYHVTWDRHYYSVPYTLVGAEVDIKATATAVTAYHRQKRVAFHPRSSIEGGSSTLREHQPKSHQRYADEQAADLVVWAETVGPSIARLFRDHLEIHRQPHIALQLCVALRKLARSVGPQRLEAACRRALAIKSTSVSSIRSILRHHLEDKPLPDDSSESTSPAPHDNVRGPTYYH